MACMHSAVIYGGASRARRVPMGPAFTVILAAALTRGRGPISRSRMCSMSLSDDLKKAEATLKGLLQDGFGPEALRPLESKINTLRARVDAEKSMPPLKSVQRKIWDLGYVIEDEESRNDSDTPARLTVMRGERRYLLEKLLRDDGAAYVDFLTLLSGKGLTENDFPSLNGIPMVSADAVEQGLSAEAAEAVRRQAVQDARRAQVEAAEAAAASSERANEAASSTFAEIDLTFATCFISSEEARFDMTPKVAGKGMWTAELQLLEFLRVVCINMKGRSIILSVSAGCQSTSQGCPATTTCATSASGSRRRTSRAASRTHPKGYP